LFRSVEEAGPDLVYTGAEDQRLRGDDGGDVGAGEQGEDGVGIGGGSSKAPRMVFPASLDVSSNACLDALRACVGLRPQAATR
jgi:hypothetical protein